MQLGRRGTSLALECLPYASKHLADMLACSSYGLAAGVWEGMCFGGAQMISFPAAKGSLFECTICTYLHVSVCMVPSPFYTIRVLSFKICQPA